MSSKVKRIIYVSHDQLNVEYGGLAKADKKSDLVLFVESARMIKGRKWHAHRLHFIISSAQHFSAELKEKGFTVEYLKAENTAAGIEETKKKYKISEVIAAQPSSFRLLNALSKLNVKFVDNDFFLTPRALFHSWAVEQKSFKMETFYRKQRVRLNLLMKGDKPIGDKWNHDADNQLPPPKNYSWPKYLKHEFDQIDEAVWLELKSLDLIGGKPSGDFATTRQGALKQLSHFLKYSFAEFGPYEDAIALDSWSLHHSLLSPYLNNGLLHPSEVIAAAIKVFNKEKISISSCEGFIRQIIGWREYVNGMYWFLGEKYKNVNHFSANRKLLPLFSDPDKTEMNCVKSTIDDIHKRAWVHHIPRLMILSNLALMTEINPQEFFEWMREVFIDATDWVMVPNIIGMGLYADGGVMMTKPYAAGGAYISRMSNYCKPCKFDPKLRSGDNACPFTTLYWDFMDRNKDEFVKNHRMSQQVFGLKRLKDLPETRKRAQEILELLSAGKV
jgi:deoxyribodipyrimidine photolyase-related protein